MTRTEFMEALQRALSGTLGSSTVNGHMRYYQEYFDLQLGMGKSEEEIVAELGNPRLLAKTIIEAAKREGMGAGAPEYDEVYEDGMVETGARNGVKQFRMPVWLLMVIVFTVIVVVVGVVCSVVSAILPVLIPILCVIMLVRLFQRK